MSQRNPQRFRQFAELVFAGSSKVDAYCAVTGKPKTKLASEAASRWWRNPATVRHVARLKGDLPIVEDVVTVPMEVARRQWDRAYFVAYVQDNLDVSPMRIAAKLEGATSLKDVVDLLTPAEHRALEGVKISRRIDSEGATIQTVEFKVTPRSAMATLLKNVAGFGPEKSASDDEDFARSIAAKIRPTVGLHGEPTNPALETQEAPA